jgi:hypothetical protein
MFWTFSQVSRDSGEKWKRKEGPGELTTFCNNVRVQ